MSIKITKPVSEEKFEFDTKIEFEGTADNNVTQVEMWADDRWLLGKTSVNQGKWKFDYTFNGSGTRIIAAKGFNASNQLIDSDDIWLFIKQPSSLDLDQKLSTNFTLREFTFSQTALMRGLDNTPTLTEIARLRRLCQQILQPARDALGPLKITSGFRSEIVNLAVGGVRNSAHRLGHAADVVPTSGDTKALAKWVVDNRQFDQVILEFGTLSRPSWIHISADSRNRKQVLRADNSGTRSISI